MRPSALSGLLICWGRCGQWRGRGDLPSLPSLFSGGRGGGIQPRWLRSPDKRSASGIPAGWAMARPGCGLRPYPGYSSAGVDAVSGAGEGTYRHYHPFFPVGEGEAHSPVGPVARISEAHPGSPRAGPWRVPDAAFGLIRATHLLVSMRSVARARGPTVTTIPFFRWERGRHTAP